MMIYVNIRKLMLLWNILTLMTFQVYSLEIKMDPGMREGQPSYIYCDVGTITTGVTFYTEPANVQGSCFGTGTGCVSTLYTITQNTTGALLEIASVDITRDEGVWYCEHGTDRSTNTTTVNTHTIAGFLLKEDWKQPVSSEALQEYTAVMTLSCTNQMPNVSFSYEDSQSNTGTVPAEAVTTTTLSSYDGITCENGNKYYVITLTASNNLAVFNNKQGVKFTFNYYGNSTAAGFSVNFLEATTTTAAATTPTTSTTVEVYAEEWRDAAAACIGVYCGLWIIHFLIIAFWKKVHVLVLQVLHVCKILMTIATLIIGIVILALGLTATVMLVVAILAIIIALLGVLIFIFALGKAYERAGIERRHLLPGGFLAFPRQSGRNPAAAPEGNEEAGNAAPPAPVAPAVIAIADVNSANRNKTLPPIQGKDGLGNDDQPGNEKSKLKKDKKKEKKKKKKTEKKKEAEEKQDGSKSPQSLSISGVEVEKKGEKTEQMGSSSKLTGVETPQND